MSLITRCPACATMFKFVPDQLKVARGWVRCGLCGEVFEASLHLVPEQAVDPGALTPGHAAALALDPAAAMPSHESLEALSFSAFPDDGLAENRMPAPDTAPSLTPAFAQSLQAAPTPQDEAGAESPEALEALEAPEEAAMQQVLPQDAMETQPDAPPTAIPAAMAAPQDPARIEPTFTGDDHAFKPDRPPVAEPVGFGVAAPDDAPFSAEPLDASDDVSFIRDAQRKAFWRTPLVRTVLGLLFILLLAALTLQWMVRQKDVLAAQEPRLAPLLQALCRPLGCEIRPLRRIESVLIESANFSKSGPNAYRLTFVLKNTGAAVLEIPALEVTLTDSRDQALVRRVLMPAQFGVTAATLKAHSELAGAVALKLAGDGDQAAAASPQAGALPVAGYRILAFYP